MIFHQPENSLSANNFNAYFYTDQSYDLHFHKSLEIIYVLKGSVNCTVNGKHQTLYPNQFGICLPYEIHSYFPNENTLYWVCVFSADYVKYFTNAVGNRTGTDFRFTCNETVKNYFISVLLNNSEQNTYMLKSVLYAICSCYLDSVTLTQRDKNMDKMIEIIEFVEKNHTNDIKLSDVARQLGYDYHYVSRIFKNLFNMKFKDFLNTYRLDHAVTLLIETDQKIVDIAMQSGFQSLRTFNNCFVKSFLITPKQYKKQLKQNDINKLTTEILHTKKSLL